MEKYDFAPLHLSGKVIVIVICQTTWFTFEKLGTAYSFSKILPRIIFCIRYNLVKYLLFYNFTKIYSQLILFYKNITAITK